MLPPPPPVCCRQQHLSGKPRPEVLHLLHCRALGSFVRGRLDCGDIDFVIAPGPGCDVVRMGPLMEGLLQRLADRGYITQVPRRVDKLHTDHAICFRGLLCMSVYCVCACVCAASSVQYYNSCQWSFHVHCFPLVVVEC